MIKCLKPFLSTEVSQVFLRTESFIDWKLKNTFFAALNARQMTVSFHVRTRDDDGLIYSVSDRQDGSKFIKFFVCAHVLSNYFLLSI